MIQGSTEDLPDVPVPYSQLLKLQESVKTPKAKKIRTLKRKLNAAERIVGLSPSPSSQISRKSARKSPHQRAISIPVKKPSVHPRQLYTENYSPEKASLKLKEALTQIDELEAKVSNLENQLKAEEAAVAKLSSVLDYKDDIIKKKSFTFDELQRKPTLFKYLCGLTVDQFNLF